MFYLCSDVNRGAATVEHNITGSLLQLGNIVLMVASSLAVPIRDLLSGDTVENGLVCVLMLLGNSTIPRIDLIPILRSLKGQKFLIKGNHDRCNDNKFLREFVKVTEYLEVKDNGRTVILCHYPIPCFKNHFYGSFHLYGHVHNSFEWNMMEHDKYLMEELYTKPCQMFNVGAMMPWMDYTPRTLDEIIAANSHNEAVRNK